MSLEPAFNGSVGGEAEAGARMRRTDGPVWATHLYSYVGVRSYCTTFWLGEDDTIGVLPVAPNDTEWAGRVRGTMMCGTAPRALVTYWMESVFDCTLLRRYENLDTLESVARVLRDAKHAEEERNP